jgi:alkylhydroperoxidase/carboxymuconolactone decarboxylase family protein YurZ
MTLALNQTRATAQKVFDGEAANDSSGVCPCSELTPREAGLVLLASDVRLGLSDSSFEHHVASALTRAALDLEHIRELLRHLAPYAGLSATATAFERLVELANLAEQVSKTHCEDAFPDASEYSAWALEGVESLDSVLAHQLRQNTANLWGRPGLTKRERALVTLANDVVGGTLGSLFAVHLAIAQQHGLNYDDIRAMIRLVGDRVPREAAEALEALAPAETT